jgi:hypothetical protein
MAAGLHSRNGLAIAMSPVANPLVDPDLPKTTAFEP